MTEAVVYDQQQAMIGGGEVMEVMMTGGDGSAMNEDTLAQVVNMLQTEGQLTGGNHTIIIRQPGSDEIQMIQATSNGGELVVTKASAEEIQALQAANVGQEILEAQQGGQVVMMDESGNLVEGMVQMQEPDGHQGVDEASVHMNDNGQMQVVEGSTMTNVSKSSVPPQHNEILDGFVSMAGVDGQNLLSSELHPPDPPPPPKPQTPITISTNTTAKKAIMSPPTNKVVSIKINTGVEKRREPKKVLTEPANVIKISTVTGRQKSQPPKFHKCESCTINFVSKVAYMNHMENCPSKKKPVAPASTKGNITYTCVFCETKFNSRLILMQHVRTCDKAKATKSQSAPKPKATTTESKLKVMGGPATKTPKGITPIKKGKKELPEKKGKNEFKLGSKRMSASATLFDPDDEDEEEVDRDLDSEEDDDEKGIVYDDDDDLNEVDFMDDDGIEDSFATDKHSQKHLGPIMTKGMYKCRDCSRTFSKEHQYNRHVKACTNAPLNAPRIVNDFEESLDASKPPEENEPPLLGVKRKRGRPSKESLMETPSPKKKKIDIPKIVSIDPKKVVSSSLASRKASKKKFSDGESDNESDYLSSSSLLQNEEFESLNQIKRKRPTKVSFNTSSRPSQKATSGSASSVSKIVKISPSDTLIKKTGKAILSKINQQKSKMARDNAFCGLCGDKFKTISELAFHTQSCHSEDVLNARDLLDGKGNLSSVKCPLCDFNFVSSQMLLFHMVSYHSRELKNVSEELETLNLNLLCPFCSITCPSQDLFKEHLATCHLDKLTNKPTAPAVSISIDVNTLIREKNNGSILPTAKLLSKQEKVLCPDCGLFLLKSYFEHHRCAAELYSPSSRKFVCSESQCSGMTFYKLIHLLTHLQQVHDKNLPCQSHSFDSITQYIEWLKKEEGKSKMKYMKALQRMKQGKLTSVWICHRFHNAIKDPSQVGAKDDSKKVDRLKQCYSRIHAETHFNTSTSRYDGKTVVKYYPEHKHVENVLSPKKAAPVPTKDATPAASSKTAFTDAAELKQLLEDDGDGSQKNASDNTPADSEANEREEDEAECEREGEGEEGQKEELPLDKPEEDEEGDGKSSEGADDIHNGPKDALESSNTEAKSPEQQELSDSEQHPPKTTNEESPPSKEVDAPIEANEETIQQQTKDESSTATDISDLESSETKESDASKKDKQPSPVSFSDADLPEDLLLEKMLGEHDAGVESEALPVEEPKAKEPTLENQSIEEAKDDLSSVDKPTPAPDQSHEALISAESKISDVDMLEAFGVSTEDSLDATIAPEENSSTSTASNTQQSSASSSSSHQPEIFDMDKDPKESKEAEMDVEENTYVLPADLEEWKKLFELVHSQVDSESLSGEELSKAKQLLVFENQITEIPIEKQVEVFNKLCSIANVQMT